MSLSRRSFVHTFAATLATSTLDPERLLWVPGAKTIFLPSAPRIVSTAEIIEAMNAMYSAKLLRNMSMAELHLWGSLNAQDLTMPTWEGQA